MAKKKAAKKVAKKAPAEEAGEEDQEDGLLLQVIAWSESSVFAAQARTDYDEKGPPGERLPVALSVLMA